MNQWLLLVMVFFVGASVSRFITADKLTEPFRDRIAEYWALRAIDVLKANSAAALVHKPDYADAASVQEMKALAYRRAFVGDKRWRKVAWSLDWFHVYSGFVKCPWCVGVWVFAAVDLFAWLVVLGAPWTVWGGPWWVTVPATVLGFRWIYGLAAAQLDD
jgi:sterol desaturase/sphingolipid hydroxylase (fatty acid hydroxylase superfamily)